MSPMPHPVKRNSAPEYPSLQDAILRRLPFGICAVNAGFGIDLFNQAFADLLLPENPDEKPATLHALFRSSTVGEHETAGLAHQFFELALACQLTRSVSEARIVLPDGDARAVRCEPLPDAGYMFVISATLCPEFCDTGPSAEHLNDVLLHLPYGLSMYSADERLMICNTKYIQDYALDSAIVKPGARYIDVLAHSNLRGNQPGLSVQQYYAKRMRENRNAQQATSLTLLWDGRTMQVINRPLPDGGWVALHEDVTEKLEVSRQIAHLANHDSLTSLPNRNTFHSRMSQVLADIDHSAGSAAVLFMDLDRFKQVNDTMGHMVGDQLLVEVAVRLKRSLCEGDLVVRLGGDEFVILQDNTSRRDAERLAQRLIGAMSEPFVIEGMIVDIGLSVGIALAPGDGTTSDTLLRHADQALYRSKSRGGGGYCFYDAAIESKGLSAMVGDDGIEPPTCPV